MAGAVAFTSFLRRSTTIVAVTCRGFSSRTATSTSAAACQIENIVTADPGQRGISPLIIPGEYLEAAHSIRKAARIGIITGFPCLMDCNPPTETDGLAGALALARAIVARGRDVVLVTDDINSDGLRVSLKACEEVWQSEQNIFGGSCRVNSFPAQETWSDDVSKCHF